MELIFSLFLIQNYLEEPTHATAYKNIRSVSATRYLQKNQWKGHFSAENFSSPSEKTNLKNIKSTINCTLKSLPKRHTKHLKSLDVKNQYNVSRGMANSKKIIIHTSSIETPNELSAIIIHELGHIVDLGGVKGHSNSGKSKFTDGRTPIYNNDKSLLFYKLSWEDSKTKKKYSKDKDFVSGYAKSDPFEDFAETYLYYRLHGEKFRQQKKKSIVLQQKYEYMKRFVFNQEFQLNKVQNSAESTQKQHWDSTLLTFQNHDLNHHCSLK